MPVVDNDLERARIASRFQLWKRALWIPTILALYVPLRALQPVAEALAGKDTNVGLAYTVNISISIVLGGTALMLLIKNRAQTNELKRQRERITELEAQLSEAKQLPSATP